MWRRRPPATAFFKTGDRLFVAKLAMAGSNAASASWYRPGHCAGAHRNAILRNERAAVKWRAMAREREIAPRFADKMWPSAR